MWSAYNSEVKRVTDAYESEVQKTEVQTDPVQRQDLCCSVVRGQVCDSVVREDRGVSSWCNTLTRSSVLQ